MKVLQLIDSLEPGGAERMAVNLANAAGDIYGLAYLCATRKEGLLKNELNSKVGYLFLNKKSATDIKALLNLKRFVKRHDISLIHAHTTSYFIAAQLKMIYPKLKIVWHEHHGARVHTTRKDNKVLVFCSRYFSKVITVNVELQQWWEKILEAGKVSYLPNFVENLPISNPIADRSKVIISLANLRIPKNHMNLLRAFKLINEQFPEWRLHLLGSDFNDGYSDELKNYISDNSLNSAVKLLGRQQEVNKYLQKTSIGVISSDEEGLPMALLEYGIAGLAVVSTDVGYSGEVISTFGNIVEKDNAEALANALSNLMTNSELRIRQGNEFREHIIQNYSVLTILPKLKSIYNS